jgi:hypothetical protein
MGGKEDEQGKGRKEIKGIGGRRGGEVEEVVLV